MISFHRHSVKTMRAKNKHPAMNESRVLIFYRSESGMVRTKNVPTKQIVAGFA